MSFHSVHLRLVPAPHPDPPYDDEEGRSQRSPDSPTIGKAVQGTLALSVPAPASAPASAPPRRSLRVVHPNEADRRPAAGSGPPPPPARWARGFVQVLLEALCGRRPVQQLLRLTSTEVYEQVQRRASRPWRVQQLPSPKSVHWSEPRDGVAEVSCVVQVGVRRHAVALRLEYLSGRWQCTALELGPI